jgi:two-component system nitrate/nitrite response regulator NarL
LAGKSVRYNDRQHANRVPSMMDRNETAPLVLIASGVAGLRKRWRQAIHGPFTVHEVAERPSLERSLTNRRPVALLLDLHLPDLDGVGGVAALQRLRPPTKIIVLTSRPDEKEGIAALKAGARGYCDREIAPILLAKALDVVQKGEIWVGRKLIPHLLEELTALTEQQQDSPAELDNRFDRITPREREIVQLLSAGASNKEIAKRLTVTERTVKAHLTAVFRKLGISGRLQLALFVLEHSRLAGHPAGIGPKFN